MLDTLKSYYAAYILLYESTSHGLQFPQVFLPSPNIDKAGVLNLGRKRAQTCFQFLHGTVTDKFLHFPPTLVFQIKFYLFCLSIIASVYWLLAYYLLVFKLQYYLCIWQC